MYTLHEIADIAGIKPKILRVWKSRYDFPSSLALKQRRKYSEEALVRTVNVSVLYNQGWRISKILKLSDDELRQKAKDMRTAASQRLKYGAMINGLVRCVLTIDQDGFRSLHKSARKRMTLNQYLEEILYPLIFRLKLLWQDHKLGQIHRNLCSEWIQIQLAEVYRILEDRSTADRKVVVWNRAYDMRLEAWIVILFLRIEGFSPLFLGESRAFTIKDIDQLRVDIEAFIILGIEGSEVITHENVLRIPQWESIRDSQLIEILRDFTESLP